MAAWLLVIGLLCVLLNPMTARTQTTDLSQATLEELMNIKVYSASKYLQSTDSAPSLVTVVTADQIQKYGYRTLADMLRGVGGFYVTYDRHDSAVGMRGFGPLDDSNARVLVLLDGHRLNDPIHNGTNIGTDFLLDVDLIDRVEVIRGPSSSLYGTNAFLGVINIITRRGAQLGGVELSGEAGSFNSYKGRMSYGRQLQRFELLLSASYYPAGVKTCSFPSSTRRKTTLAWRSTEMTTLTAASSASLPSTNSCFAEAIFIARRATLPPHNLPSSTIQAIAASISIAFWICSIRTRSPATGTPCCAFTAILPALMVSIGGASRPPPPRCSAMTTRAAPGGVAR